jgi:MGT family glycosyltransferase
VKAVFFGFPVHGHTNPTLPVVRKLVEKGEQVTYYSSQAFRDPILKTGASYREYESHFLKDPQHVTASLSQLPYLMMEAAKSVLEHELDELRGSDYDYLIHDAMAPWGKCLADLLDLPAISSITTFALSKRVASLGRGLYRPPLSATRFLAKTYSIIRSIRVRKRIRKHYQTRHPHLMELYFCPEQLNLVYTSHEFQPFSKTFGESFRFVGTCLGERESQHDPDWQLRDNEPLIYVSMGTLFNLEPELYGQIFEVLKQIPYRVVASVSSELPRSALGKIPDNWILKPHVPQLKILPRSILFISRGGMNSVNEALYFGKPLLIIPYLLEQAIVARRVADLGAGLVLSPREVTPQKLRETINELIFNPTYAAAARELGAGLREAGGEERAAQEILSYVRAQKRGTGDG